MRVFIILAVCCIAAYGQSHDLSIGQATYGDAVIYRVQEQKYGFPLVVRTSIIEYPIPGVQNYATIQAIHIKDHMTDGSGGYPTISAGGIGQKFVKIKLKSQRGNGLNFTVTIFGRYR